MPKATAKKTAPKNAAHKVPLPAGVRVRMYRPGLGDCFLLTFSDGAKHEHVLIDCGVFVGTPDQKERLNVIARHIRSETSNRLSALVATHEHWDHVAGFHFARDEFDQLKTNEVWLAWTEDPDQGIAKEAKLERNAMAKAVGMAVSKLAESGSPYDRECGLAAARVMDFDTVFGAAKFSKQSDAAMDFVTAKRKAKDRFLEPGDTIFRGGWVPGGVRVYVLSPPMDRAALRQDRTPEEEGFKTHKKKDGAAMAWAAAVLGAFDTGDDQVAASRLLPFDASLAWPERDILNPGLDTEEKKPIRELASGYRDAEWRRIDNDWLGQAATLALQLDNSINNTSLVLAFELIQTGQVLLFVGDSELESWKSWQNREFKVDGKKVSARDLLSRTVFYKVGHHGSGNATLRAGLNAMTSPDLVAAVPTDEAFAREKQGWEMPAVKLGPVLRKLARGRVLYADPGRKSIRENNPEGISAASWNRFLRNVTEDPLFVDYRIEI